MVNYFSGKRKPLIIVFSLVILILFIYALSGEGFSKRPEWRAQAEFYVAVDGNDNHDGSKRRPFRTIAKARDEIRKINKNMTGDIMVYIEAGDYYLDSTICFRNIDSGTNGYKVIYKNLNEKGSARILGASPVTQWEKHDGRIYKTKIDGESDINFIYEDNHRSEVARFPNREEGMHVYLRAAEEDSALMTNHLFFKEGTIPKVKDPSALCMYFFGGGLDWNQKIEPIESIDYHTNSIKVMHEQPVRYSFSEGTRYFVMGHAMELLDAPGELFYDKGNGLLYYIPVNEKNLLNNGVFVPKVDVVLDFIGENLSDGNPGHVQNIVIEGLTVGMTDYSLGHTKDDDYSHQSGAISLTNVRNIELIDCRIVNSANNAINFNGYSQNNRVIGNYIQEAGACGIYFHGGYTPTVNPINRNNIIQNNFITNIGYLAGGGGILIAGSAHNSIENNLVCNCLRWGIALIGPGLSLNIMQLGEIDGIKVNKDNPEENIQFLPTRNNIIAHNETVNCNTDSQDSGPIVTWGACHTTVDHNLVYGTRGFGNQEGVYIDGGSHFTKVTNNIVYDISSSPNGKWKANSSSFHIKGIKSEACNNIFDFTTIDGVQGIGFQSMVGNIEISENIVFKRNILCSFSSTAGPILRMHDRSGRPLENRFAVVDSNLYYTENKNFEIIAFRHGIEGKRKLDRDTWKMIQDYKYDQNSVFDENPLFVNAAVRNYTLKDNSPALKLGFRQIDASTIGLTDKFVYKQETLKFIETSRNAKQYIVRER
ncbi:MAG: hypothetical protein RBS73_08625 [Prolixibacteraceae bacterium]|jgi:hypothetical protein|nr:hypothetical protein [Prolixibacteraceae bacterium]